MTFIKCLIFLSYHIISLQKMKLEEKLDENDFLEDGFAYGPYKIKSITDNSVELIRNKYFSKKLR